MARTLALTAAILGACAAPTAPAPPPTTTTAPPEPTTAPTTAPPPQVAAPVPPAAAPAGVGGTTVAPTPDDAFWRRLADCECASGACGGAHIGWFQFSRDTAAKVDVDGSEPYEEQRAAAQEWARRIHPNEGTRSGWPHCWWVAA